MKVIIYVDPSTTLPDGSRPTPRLVRRYGSEVTGLGVEFEADDAVLSDKAKRLIKALEGNLSDMQGDDLSPQLKQRLRYPGIREAAKELGYPEECADFYAPMWGDMLEEQRREWVWPLRAAGLYHGWKMGGAEGLARAINSLADRAGLYLDYGFEGRPFDPDSLEDTGQAYVWEHTLNRAKQTLEINRIKNGQSLESETNAGGR